LNVSRLPAFDISEQAPLWWGQMGIVAIESAMFGLLIATYLYYRLSFDVWPPPGARLPSVIEPTVALIPLLLSAAASYWATEGAKENNRSKMIYAMAGNLIFAAIFLVMRIREWSSFSFKWSSDAYGTIVWAILGLHSFDYVAGMVETLVLLAIILSGRYGQKQRQGVHVDSVVWYLVVAIWIPLYVTIYWGPRLLKG
jgi:heme/copper-type cytochrome/quinol oxidase subunit 3